MSGSGEGAINLSDFQQQVDALLLKKTSVSGGFIGVWVDQDRWLVPLSMIQEVSVPPLLSRLGKMPQSFLGIGTLRGRIFTFLDMRFLIKKEKNTVSHLGWVTPLKPEKSGGLGEVALVWPQMVGIVSLDDCREVEVLQCPPLSKKRWQDQSGHLWWELDLEQLKVQDILEKG